MDRRFRSARGCLADLPVQRQPRAAHVPAVSAAPPLAHLVRLSRDPVPTPWDSELAAAMLRHSVRIEEELSLDVLLEDLSPS